MATNTTDIFSDASIEVSIQPESAPAIGYVPTAQIPTAASIEATTLSSGYIFQYEKPIFKAVFECNSEKLAAYLTHNMNEVSLGGKPLIWYCFFNPLNNLEKVLFFVDLLQKLGSNINERNTLGETLLMYYVKKNNPNTFFLIPHLKKMGLDPNLPNEKNRNFTALHYAVEIGSVNLVELVIKEGANLEAVDSEGNTPLLRAAQNKKWDVVKALIEAGANINHTNTEGYGLAYYYLSKEEDHQFFHYLFTKKLDLHFTSSDPKRNTLYIAAGFGRPGILKLLFAGISERAFFFPMCNGLTLMQYAEAHLDTSTEEALQCKKHTMDFLKQEELNRKLMEATVKKDLPMVQAYKAQGAKMYFANLRRLTPLMIAARLGEVEMVRWMLENGPIDQLVFQSRIGITALVNAVTYDHGEVVSVLLDPKFKATEAQLRIGDNEGYTVVHYAVIYKKPQRLKQLLELTPNAEKHIEACDKFGNSPLVMAVFIAEIECLEILLSYAKSTKSLLFKADVNGRIPLFCAIPTRNALKVVEILLKFYPVEQVLHQDVNGMSPLMLATSLGKKDIVELLLQHQGDIQKCLKDRQGNTYLDFEPCLEVEQTITLPAELLDFEILMNPQQSGTLNTVSKPHMSSSKAGSVLGKHPLDVNSSSTRHSTNKIKRLKK